MEIGGNWRIYGLEDECDVIFMVGAEGDEVWRLPAHLEILKNANPVFFAMFSDHFVPFLIDDRHTIIVPDVDGRAFDNLLRFLYNEQPSIQSIETALTTLYAGQKYLCPGLVELCTDYLSGHLNDSNVLAILKFVRVLSGEIQNLENVSREQEEKLSSTNGSAKDDNIENKSRSIRSNSADINQIEVDCANLLTRCLHLIDRHAKKIISSEELEDLDLTTIKIILSRDTLDVPNEEFVFSAILKWADKECKRSQLPLTSVSKRQVLGAEALFLPRYLTMNLCNFESGPAQSGLLTPEETHLIRILLKEIEDQKGQKQNGDNYEPSAPESALVNSPSTLISPFIEQMIRPRTPIRSSADGKKSRNCKKTRFKLLEKWLTLRKCKKCCGKNNRFANSPPQTPIKSSTSQGGKGKGVKKFNSFVEHAVICFACLFD